MNSNNVRVKMPDLARGPKQKASGLTTEGEKSLQNSYQNTPPLTVMKLLKTFAARVTL